MQASVIRTYRYRVMPKRHQHAALGAILEDQRQLYNAALEERIEAYRKAAVRRTYFDQTRALTEWRRCDADAAAQPVNLQRHTLKRVDDAYNAFFRRVRSGQQPGFPRFRSQGRFRTFGFREFDGISLVGSAVRFGDVAEVGERAGGNLIGAAELTSDTPKLSGQS